MLIDYQRAADAGKKKSKKYERKISASRKRDVLVIDFIDYFSRKSSPNTL